MSHLALEAAQALARNDLRTAEKLALEALKEESANADLQLVLSAVYLRTGRFDEALGELDKMLSEDPNSAEGLRLRIEALRQGGRVDEALTSANFLCALSPGSPDAHLARGLCYLALKRPAEAERDLREALTKLQAPRIMHYLGTALGMQDRPGEAVPFFQKAMALEPQVPNHAIALGQALLEDDRPEESIKAIRRALSIRPRDFSLLLMLVQALSEAGRISEAEGVLRSDVQTNPGSAEANVHLGIWLHQMGRFEEADGYLTRGLELDPLRPLPLFYKISGKKATEADRGLMLQMRSRIDDAATSVDDKVALHFGLGKAHDDLDELATAFSHFEDAHRLASFLQRRFYDSAKEELSLKRQLEVFTADKLATYRHGADQSGRPIFVVGMIRSGTTLMEQLLSAHPDVAGAGELSYWLQNGYGTLNPSLDAVDAAKGRQKATTYLRMLEQHSVSERNVVDKMPLNYWMLGFIHACLPNARIVHMLRDPVDIALSIWMTFIRRPPVFANRRLEIVHALGIHYRLQRHWLSVLPQDRYRQVRYEDLTRDPATVMDEILGFCGLEWNEACIHPEQNERFVSTPSLYRVRRPIDSRSVSKHERYAPFLGEFAQLLKEENISE